MTNEDLKLITAANIINLRRRDGYTQSELGAKLNYSDKTISKWERGEAIPDAFVLTCLAQIFGVSVDYLLSSHDAWEPPQDREEKKKVSETMYSSDMIIIVTLLGIMTAALTAFVAGWILGTVEWRIFLIGLFLTVLTYLILDCVFKKAKHLKISLIMLIVSAFILIYFVFNEKNIWQIFIVMIPAIAIAVLSTYISKKPGVVHHLDKKSMKAYSEKE